MARLHVTVDTAGAAFDPYPEHETARLLQQLADVLADRGAYFERPADGHLYDANGNPALYWRVEA